VLEVVSGSPADGAGIRAGDLLIDLDGQRMNRVADLQRLLQHEVIGSRMTVTLLRDGRERQLQIVPVELG
jgi:serine protease Do